VATTPTALNDQPDITPASGRSGSGSLRTGWGDKLPEDVVFAAKPLYRRHWFRRLMFVLACVAGLALAVALAVFVRSQQDQWVELRAQRNSLGRFLQSDEFAAFSADADRQLVAAFNYIVVQPRSAAALFPAVAAWETAHRLPSWTAQQLPLPVSAAEQPARVARTGRDLGVLLVRRGFVFDEPRRAEARRLFLRLLAPHLQAFLRRAPDNGFNALQVDRGLQELALAAYAARAAPEFGALDAERLFVLYAIVGPPMWREIDRQSAGAAVFGAPAAPRR
jgi:hypothetical protein